MPNVSTIRAIKYSTNGMLVFKASAIGVGLFVPFKNIKFISNMKIVSSFDTRLDRSPSLLMQSR
jgi:hypothetical protein